MANGTGQQNELSSDNAVNSISRKEVVDIAHEFMFQSAGREMKAEDKEYERGFQNGVAWLLIDILKELED